MEKQKILYAFQGPCENRAPQGCCSGVVWESLEISEIAQVIRQVIGTGDQ